MANIGRLAVCSMGRNALRSIISAHSDRQDIDVLGNASPSYPGAIER